MGAEGSRGVETGSDPIELLCAALASVQAELEHAQEENRRRDEFLAVLGHELRNPLTAIALATDVLVEEVGPEREERAGRTCRILKRNTDQLRRLVDDLLDVALVTRGKLALASDDIDLRDVVAAAAETMHPVLSARHHQLAVVRPRQRVLVRGDPSRLGQVLSNLLDNAAKYTPLGGHVEIALGRQAGRAVIAVSDDGIGMPADMLERVFDPFERIPGAGGRAGSGHGLGLGLALVRQLVELHGGSVRALSPGEGKGSTIVVELPLAVGDT
jgi:signal transduction histidine kinase